MKSILIGIPSIRNYQPFWESMSKLLPEMNSKYRIEVLEVKGKAIADARTKIADFFLERDYDYLLFLDDDHSGHTIEMVEALLLPDEYVCAIKCYSRFFPFLPNLMDYSGIDDPRMKYQRKNVEKGYAFCNIVGFGMTLIKKEAFSKITPPYFVAQDNAKEDNYFCDALQKVGIKPMGCFDYVLAHQGIDDSNMQEYLDNGVNSLIEDLKVKMPGYKLEDIVVVA